MGEIVMLLGRVLFVAEIGDRIRGSCSKLSLIELSRVFLQSACRNADGDPVGKGLGELVIVPALLADGPSRDDSCGQEAGVEAIVGLQRNP